MSFPGAAASHCFMISLPFFLLFFSRTESSGEGFHSPLVRRWDLVCHFKLFFCLWPRCGCLIVSWGSACAARSAGRSFCFGSLASVVVIVQPVFGFSLFSARAARRQASLFLLAFGFH
jgi:hypothetical protein